MFQHCQRTQQVAIVREAILQKIPEFYEKFSQTGGGSTGFHISYSELVILPKFVENLNKQAHKLQATLVRNYHPLTDGGEV